MKTLLKTLHSPSFYSWFWKLKNIEELILIIIKINSYIINIWLTTYYKSRIKSEHSDHKSMFFRMKKLFRFGTKVSGRD